MSEHDFDDFYDDEPDYDDEPEDDDGIGGNCSGWFSEHDENRFVCGAIGSEDCDFCCLNRWMLGMTPDEAEAVEVQRWAAEERHREWLKLKDYAP
jgi:hypothetical protein